MAHKSEKYGLRKEDIEFIRKICSKHAAVEKAVLFVLRETGDFALTSDLEIAFCGKNVTKEIIKDAMGTIKKEGSNRIWFDIVHYEGLESDELRDFIDDNGIILYQKNTETDDDYFVS